MSEIKTARERFDEFCKEKLPPVLPDIFLRRCFEDEVADLRNRIAQLEADLAAAKLSDRDKEDLEIGKQIRRAAACLPDYFDIKIHVENGFAGVTLIDKKGNCRDFDFEEHLSSAISEAIDAAIKESSK